MKLTRCHKISWFFFTTSLKAYLTIIMDGKMAFGFLIGDAIASKYFCEAWGEKVSFVHIYFSQAGFQEIGFCSSDISERISINIRLPFLSGTRFNVKHYMNVILPEIPQSTLPEYLVASFAPLIWLQDSFLQSELPSLC